MGQSRAAEAPRVPRDRWVWLLHRHPTRWDALLHQLAESLARRYWYAQAHFQSPTMRLDGDELWDCAMAMARAFGLRMSYAAVAHLAGGPKEASVFTMHEPGAMTKTVDAGERAIREALLNYLEVGQNTFIRRDHPDLRQFYPRIQETLERFLSTKCSPEGELYPCLQKPLASDEEHFPASELPADPAESSGNAALDAYRLNVLVHDEDGPAQVMWKLVAWVKSDPLVGPEFAVAMVSRLALRQKAAAELQIKFDELAEAVQVRTRFLFFPCRQGGRTPMEIFASRQLMASERQKVRLAGWVERNMDGVFRLGKRHGERVTLVDVSSGRELEVKAEGPLETLAEGRFVRALLLPWDDLWLIAGTMHVVDEQRSDESVFRAMTHPLYTRRAIDEQDPRLVAARRLMKTICDRFVARFGGELATFDTIEQCREAMASLHFELVMELRMEDGRQFADVWRDEVGCDFPPFYADALGTDEGELGSVGVVCDKVYGMALLPESDQIGLAMTSPFPDQTQKQKVERLLMEQWRPGWMLEKIFAGNPARAEEIIREVIGDAEFEIRRDLKSLLGRLKAPEYTLPPRPKAFL